MKVKKFESKLVLMKSTIANLDVREMMAINGGVLGTTDGISCGGVCISVVETGCCTKEQ